MEKQARSCGTHNGTFHADEVTACALLALFDCIDSDKIIRTRDPRLLDRCEYVCDVGCVWDPSQKLFDHHQRDYTGSLSSAGMVLNYLLSIGKIDQDLFDHFYYRLIKGVDEHDNGLSPSIEGYAFFSHIVSNFLPLDYDAPAEEFDAAFKEAFLFVFGHLKRMMERFFCFKKYRDVVKKEMSKKEPLLVFEQSLPWQELFFVLGGNAHPARFAILPESGQWKLRGIPRSDKERMSVRKAFPKAWAGLSGKELELASGISGAVFCHKGRFISVWQTKEAALKAYEIVMKESENG